MRRPRTAVTLGMFQPTRRSSGLFPLVLLTLLCGALGLVVWPPYGVLLGVCPPALVFGYTYWWDDASGADDVPATRSADSEETPPSLDGRVDLFAALVSAGVLQSDAAGRPAISARFEAEWRSRMADVGDRDGDREALARLIGVHPARVELDWAGEWDDRELVARLDGGSVGRWASRAAFVADLTAVAVFRRHYPAWWRLPTADRNRVLGALRLSLRECPTCDGPVTVDAAPALDRDEDGRHVTATCGACGALLFDAFVRGPPPVPVDTDTEAGPATHSSR